MFQQETELLYTANDKNKNFYDLIINLTDLYMHLVSF